MNDEIWVIGLDLYHIVYFDFNMKIWGVYKGAYDCDDHNL